MKNKLLESFEELRSEKNTKKRGLTFEREFLRDYFESQDVEYTPPFRTKTEQIDGSISFGYCHFLIESKWHAKPVVAKDVRDFKMKVTSRGIDGVFLSISGFTGPAKLESAKVGNVILFRGTEFERMLRDRLDFKEILEHKHRELKLKGNCCFEVGDILSRKRQVVSEYQEQHFREISETYQPEISGYIQRKVIAGEYYGELGDIVSLVSERSTTLADALKGEAQTIVLLSDAGLGKSFELKHLGFTLASEQSGVVPVFVELNQYADGDLEDYITMKSRLDISRFEGLELAFLLDGFDETMDKHLTARKIKAFAQRFSACRLVISCRTNLYANQFPDFSVFYLLPLEWDQIKENSLSILKDESATFLRRLNETKLLDVAKNPFYLNELIKIYKTEGDIPDNKSEIFEKVVTESLEREKGKFVDKIDFERDYPIKEMRRQLEFLALGMETLQTNTVSVNDFSRVFEDSKLREVISQLGLLKSVSFKGEMYYQFQHNNFQEYLAAKKLSSFDFEAVLDFVSYPKIAKVNPSWLNSVAFLARIYPRSELSDFIIGNDPEVALKFEADRLKEETKEAIFKAVFEKYTHRKIWIDRDIDHEELARFGESEKILDYLMGYARSSEHFTFRFNAIDMLGRMKRLKSPELVDLLIRYAKDEEENTNVRHSCLYALSRLGADDRMVIEKLKDLRLSEDDWILSGLYSLIKESRFLDDYIDILLDGIKHTRIDLRSSKDRLFDLSWNIKHGIESVTSFPGINKIIEHFVRYPGDSEEISLRGTLGRVIDNLIPLYSSDNQCFELVVRLLESLAGKYLHQTERDIVRFFDKTGTRYQAFRDLHKKYKTSDRGDIPALICDDEGVDFLIKEYKKGKLSDEEMQAFLNHLAWKNKEGYPRYLEIVNKRTGKFLPPPSRDYEKERREEFERKVSIVFDKGLLLEEIQRIFKREAEARIGYKQLGEIRSDNWKEGRYDEFVLSELMKIFAQDQERTWVFEDIKKSIDRADYASFTARHAFDILQENPNLELKDEQVRIIEEYCRAKLTEVDFRQALKRQTNRTVSVDRDAMFLWFFMRRLSFTYPQPVLLDMISFDWIEGHQYLGIEYLEELVALQKMKERVLENLESGIEANPVLENHIKFCMKHKVIESFADLKKIVTNPKKDFEIRTLALETVAQFPDSTTFLQSLLESRDEKLSLECARILLAHDNLKAIQKLEQNVLSGAGSLALASAQLLIPRQNLKAIEYYLNHLKKEQRRFLPREDRDVFYGIKTPEVLPMLFDLLEYAYQIEIPEDAFDRLDNAIIRLLTGMATGSAEDYVAVKKGLKEFIERCTGKYRDVNFLEVTCDEIDKNYLINYKRDLTVEQVVSKIRTLEAKAG